MATCLEWVDIGAGMQMPAHSTWTVEYDGTMDLEVEVIAEPGRVRVSAVHLLERDEAGIVDVVVDSMRLGGDVLDIIAIAAVTQGGIPRGGNVWGSAETPEEVQLVGRVVAKARRNRLTKQRLVKLADAYNGAGGGQDGIEAMEAVEHRTAVDHRYTYTLLKAARNAGLIERPDDGPQS